MTNKSLGDLANRPTEQPDSLSDLANRSTVRPLPDGWTWTTIGEVAKVNYRDPALREMPDELEVTFVPMAAVDEIDGKIADPQTDPLKKRRKGYTPFSEGDVLFAKITPCMENGKAAIARNLKNGLGFGSTEFHVMKPGENVLAEWLFYYVRQSSFRDEAKANFSGTAGQLRVKKNFILDSPIPIPSTLVQERIVAEIEKQFTRLDQAVASLRRLQSNLARYKASVLKAACDGRLVPQDPNDEPAADLLARILAERRAQWQAANPGKKYKEVEGVEETADLPELPHGWDWTTIDQVSECLDSMRIPVNKKERAKRQGDIPYYGANGQVGWIDDYLFDEPLVLLVEDETFTGREKPFTYKITGKTWVNNHAHVLRATATTTDYLNYSLMFYPFTPLTTGTTGRRKLTQRALRAAPYALPPIAEQERIVAEVERRLSVVTTIEQTITANLSRAERLRQSILHRAFTGQLVPQKSSNKSALQTAQGQ